MESVESVARNSDQNFALLIDFENIGKPEDMRALLDELSGDGRVVVKRAFGDWKDQKPDKQKHLQTLGIDLIHHTHTTTGKNASDIRLTVDAIDLLHRSPVGIDNFVIASCDSDFFPLVTFLRSFGKLVTIAGRKSATSDISVNSCDRYIDLEELVRDDIEKTPLPDVPEMNPKRETSSDDCESSMSNDDAGDLISARTKTTPMASVTFESRRLVSRAFRSASDTEGEVKGAKLHGAMRRIDPSFNFRNLGFVSFSDFLDNIPEVDVERSNGPQDIVIRLQRNQPVVVTES